MGRLVTVKGPDYRVAPLITLPGLHISGMHAKNRVCIWNRHMLPIPIQRRIAQLQFIQQMEPLVIQLALGDGERNRLPDRLDLVLIEGVAPLCRLIMYALEI